MSEVRSDTKARTIVTLFEQYGAGAEVIGPRVAEALGTRFMDQAVSSETLEAAAERDLVEENFFERFLRSFTPMPSADADLAWALEVRTDHEVSADLAERLLAAVEDGGVVLGRNATKILADEPRALHVKLVGSVASRVARAANLAGISIEQASRRQEREPGARRYLPPALPLGPARGRRLRPGDRHRHLHPRPSRQPDREQPTGCAIPDRQARTAPPGPRRRTPRPQPSASAAAIDELT